jgi:hypothetical protein
MILKKIIIQYLLSYFENKIPNYCLWSKYVKISYDVIECAWLHNRSFHDLSVDLF